EMAEEHRRHRDAQGERSVERLSRGTVSNQGLDSQFHGSHQSREVDADISGNSTRYDATERCRRRSGSESAVNEMSYHWDYNSDVETIGADRGDASVSEQECLNNERNGDRQDRRPGSQEDGHNRGTGSVSCCSTRDGNIEQHHNERECRAHREKWNVSRPQCSFKRPGSFGPERHHHSEKRYVGLRYQIPVRNVHQFTPEIWI